MNRIQAPVTGNNKNAASYEQKTMAGAEMEEVAGRKELEAHWVRVCDRLRKEIGDKAFKTWFGEVELGKLEDRQAPPLCPDALRARLGRPPLWRPGAGLLAGGARRGEQRRGQPRAAAGAAPGQRHHRHAAGADLAAELPVVGDAAPGPGDRPRWRGGLPGPRGALHLRQLRGRQAQRVRLCRRAQHRRAGPAAARAQPALYLRRRRPRQDPSDACHLARHPRARSQDAACSISRPRASCTASSRRCAPRTPASSRSCSAPSTC